MREIKFRAWDKDENEMVLNPYLGHIDNADTSDLMQYTGTKDMNGKEIYEGDIIRKEECSPDDMAFGFYGSIGVVKYYAPNMGFLIDTSDTGDDGFYDNMGANFSFNEIEVIGNIYENQGRYGTTGGE